MPAVNQQVLFRHEMQPQILDKHRAPVWLKTAFAVLVQEGEGLVHGWCAEKENRGKGGSQGKIGAKVVRKCVLAGCSQAPILEFLAPLLDLSGSS